MIAKHHGGRPLHSSELLTLPRLDLFYLLHYYNALSAKSNSLSSKKVEFSPRTDMPHKTPPVDFSKK